MYVCIPRLSFDGRNFSNTRRTFFFFGGKKVEIVSICKPICTDYFFILISCFYSYASFIILPLQVPFVKLEEFQIRAKKDDNLSVDFVQSQ